MNHVTGPHAPRLVLAQPLRLQLHLSNSPHNPSSGFCLFSPLSFLPPLPNTLLTLIHCPPFFAQFTPLGRIITPSAVTKEMHTPSITMYKFSARGFGRVLIKKPFHSFSSEIIRLSSHQDATSIDLFFSTRKSIGEREKKKTQNKFKDL